MKEAGISQDDRWMRMRPMGPMPIACVNLWVMARSSVDPDGSLTAMGLESWKILEMQPPQRVTHERWFKFVEWGLGRTLRVRTRPDLSFCVE